MLSFFISAGKCIKNVPEKQTLLVSDNLREGEQLFFF